MPGSARSGCCIRRCSVILQRVATGGDGGLVEASWSAGEGASRDDVKWVSRVSCFNTTTLE